LVADAERGKIEVVHVLNGGFLDRGVMFGFIRAIDIEAQTAFVLGDGKQPIDWTTYADAARYVAEVAVDERSVPAQILHCGCAHDGLEREFNFFNQLEGSVCTMCAPKGQRKSQESQSG
jgi:hypothetical protein